MYIIYIYLIPFYDLGALTLPSLAVLAIWPNSVDNKKRARKLYELRAYAQLRLKVAKSAEKKAKEKAN